jgi:DoxX-like protein
MKKYKIMFWITTTIIFLMEGVMPALYGNSPEAKQGISHLGYPEYFGIMLVFFKVPGALALIIPKVPHRVKEWAYAGFAFDFIAAFVSYWCVDGPNALTFFPLLFLVLLVLSYISYHKIHHFTKS